MDSGLNDNSEEIPPNFNNTENENNNSTLDIKVAPEDHSLQEEETDAIFEKHLERKSITFNYEQDDHGDIFIYDEGARAEQDELSRKFSRISRRYMFETDISEVCEEEEETGSFISEQFPETDSAKITLPLDTKVISTEEILFQAKSKLQVRAASIYEQRLNTIFSLKDYLMERKKLELKNRMLHDKCCDYLKKFTTVGQFESTSGVLPLHGDQRYYNVLENFMYMKALHDKTKSIFQEETDNLTDSYYIFRAKFEQIFDEFKSRELEVGLSCMSGRTGKGFNEQRVRSMVRKQERRFALLAEIRVYYLKLHNRLAGINRKLKALNVIGGDHTLMEYEELTINNNSLIDKLDEREEELRKLRDKCTEDASILNYLKTTCKGFVRDIRDAAEELEDVVERKSEERTILAEQLKNKDLLRSMKMQVAPGHLTSPRLLRELKKNWQTLADIRQKIDQS